MGKQRHSCAAGFMESYSMQEQGGSLSRLSAMLPEDGGMNGQMDRHSMVQSE